MGFKEWGGEAGKWEKNKDMGKDGGHRDPNSGS